MADLPYMKFFPTDWLADCSVLSLAARGAWQTLLCKMWHPAHRGCLTLPLPAMARLLGATPDETEAVLDELSGLGVADVTRDGDNYTVTSRRVSRDWGAAEELRKKLSDAGRKGGKTKKASPNKKPPLKPGLSHPSSEAKAPPKAQPKPPPDEGLGSGLSKPESRIQKPDSTSAATATARAREPMPPTREEVAELAGHTPYPLTPECAEAYWLEREAVGWCKRGQPITNWRTDLQRFASHWNQNERSKRNHETSRAGKRAGQADRRGTGGDAGAGDGIDVPEL